jgi:hypothetical protein
MLEVDIKECDCSFQVVLWTLAKNATETLLNMDIS